ncbi:hypothetical protein ACWD1Z_26260 [Streptomyces sp. NPDC002784]
MTLSMPEPSVAVSVTPTPVPSVAPTPVVVLATVTDVMRVSPTVVSAWAAGATAARATRGPTVTTAA